MNRRHLFQSAAGFAAASHLSFSSPSAGAAQGGGKRFKASLAEWSLHKAIQSRLVTNLDFPRIAREHFGIEGLEFVNGLWEAPTSDYLRRLKGNMAKTGTKAVLIMVDGEGSMGHIDKAQAMQSVEGHKKWVDIAADLGCHSIRTNMYPGEKQPATEAEVAAFIDRCVESFGRLCEYAAPRKINVIIENHGGVSSKPDVVVRLMKAAKLANLGTLPDFGNFYEPGLSFYEAVKALMPYAKGVSFKCYYDGPGGTETKYDVDKMFDVVKASSYSGYVGIEFEGRVLTEFEGIQRAKRDLDRIIG